MQDQTTSSVNLPILFCPRSSVGQSAALVMRMSQVRILSGAFVIADHNDDNEVMSRASLALC
jgi:hypothetical protein